MVGLTVGGGLEVAAVTVMAKAGSAAFEVPSLALMTIFESVPRSALAGMPLSAPVAILKDAHEGLSATL
jgi:hypothetical protein